MGEVAVEIAVIFLAIGAFETGIVNSGAGTAVLADGLTGEGQDGSEEQEEVHCTFNDAENRGDQLHQQ